MEQASDDVLAAVRPQQSAIQSIGMYVFGAVFFGLLPMFLIMPFGLPTGHPAYLIAWVFGAVVSTVVIHRKIGRMRDRAHLTLTTRHLVLGANETTSVQLSDIVDTVPILSEHKPLQTPSAAVNAEQFTVVLLRLRDGSRLPLSAIHGMQGFENFLIKLFEGVGPSIRTQGELTAADIAVLGTRNANKRHRPDN